MHRCSIVRVLGKSDRTYYVHYRALIPLGVELRDAVIAASVAASAWRHIPSMIGPSAVLPLQGSRDLLPPIIRYFS